MTVGDPPCSVVVSLMNMKSTAKPTREFCWIPSKASDSAHGVRRTIKDVRSKPARVWTLLWNSGEDWAPEKDFRPVHGANAHLEDIGHDWRWANGTLTYFSRLAEPGEGIWILIEYVD